MTAERVLFTCDVGWFLGIGLTAAAGQAVHGTVSCNPPPTWAAAVIKLLDS